MNAPTIDMLRQHLPVLVVVVPLIAAPLAFLLRGRGPWIVAMAASAAAFAMAVLLAVTVAVDGPISYDIGNWAPPIGIEYRLDALNTLVLVLVAGVGAVVFPYARPSLRRELDPETEPIAFTLLLLSLAGMLGVIVTGDAFNVFVFLEISSLSAYVLVALGGRRDRRALTAAYSYLVMGATGATFFVIGLGLAYMMTGTLNMADLAARLPAVHDHPTVAAACAFITVGLALKLAMFPLHLWLPNAYTHAPSAVAAFFAACSTKVAIYLLLRFLFDIFDLALVFQTLRLDLVFLPLACLGMLVGSIVAIFQNDVKRMLAYSSVAQIGYILLGIALGTSAGLTASLLHVFNHGLMKGALFLILGMVTFSRGHSRLEALAGLSRRSPTLFAAFLIGALSLIGVPLTSGFVSKWFLVRAALDAGAWPLVALIVGTSLLAVVYLWRVVEVAMFSPTPQADQTSHAGESEGAHQKIPTLMHATTWVLVLANLYFGIDPRLPIDFATRAAQLLIGGT